ncbi:radical SAM protein [Thermodesulfobacteriota bacterium]
MNLGSAISSFWSDRPFHLVLFTTARCNLNCHHCFYREEIHRRNGREELTSDEFEEIARHYGKIQYLTLSGGEPTLREDLAGICEAFYRHCRVDTIALHTNGFLTDRVASATGEILERCDGAQINVGLSLDGFESTHDSIRRVSGSFRNTLQTLERLQQIKGSNPRLSINLSSVYMKENQLELEDLYNWMQREYGLPHYVELIRGNTENPDSKDVDFDRYRAFLRKKYIGDVFDKKYRFSSIKRELDYISKEIMVESILQQKMMVPCKAGLRSIVIAEDGHVYPCETLKETMGNLRDHGYRIGEILALANSKEMLRRIKEEECFCDWRCIVPLNLVYHWRGYPYLSYRIMRQMLGRFFSTDSA